MKKTIKVSPEGRKDIWIPEKQSLLDFIVSKKLKQIHNFIPTDRMILGADHSVDSVLRDIKNANRLVLFTNPTANMGHSLSLITAEKLECYDIGKITEDDLQIITQDKETWEEEVKRQCKIRNLPYKDVHYICSQVQLSALTKGREEVLKEMDNAINLFNVTDSKPPFYEPVKDKDATKEIRSAMRFMKKYVLSALNKE